MATSTAPSFNVAAVILAGGQSRRMGRDKALLDWHGRPLILHIAQQLEPHFVQLLIASHQKQYPFLPHATLNDNYPGCGPLAGLEAALKASPTEWLFCTTCDTPRQPLWLVEKLYQLRDGAQCVVTVNAEDKRNPLFGFYHTSLAAAARQLLETGQFSVQSLLDNTSTALLKVDSGQLADLDNYSDYTDALESP